jgi:serine protease Do
MTEFSADPVRQPWFKKTRSTAIGFGVGAALALPSLVWAPPVWAQNPPAAAQPAPASPQATAMLPQQSFAPLVKRVLPAVVNISVTEKAASNVVSEQMPESFRGTPFEDFLKRFFKEQGGGRLGQGPFSENPDEENGVKRIALGSGFIVDPSGLIVTNNHVVGEAAKAEVILQDNTKYPATIVGRDPRTDIAVLKIKADKPLPYVAFGDSGAAQVGDWVVAVGNPFGLGGSVTTGIISARGRDIHSGQFDDFLQIDAPINRGNSGGPTFNLNGEVIGINTAIYSPNGGSVGIGFAVPSNVAKSVVAQLESGGKVSRGWLGVQIQEVTPAIAASLGLEGEHGALVAVVTPKSPGAQAGLKQGDVILSFNGSAVKELRDLPRLVAAATPGATGALTVWRNGKSSELQVTLGEAPANPQVASANGEQSGEQSAEQSGENQGDALGMHFVALTSELRRELHVGRDVHGVVVSGIDRSSAAASLGLTRGDVVVSINQLPVHTPQEAAQQLKDAAKSPKKTALLLLNRHGVTQYVGINLSKDEG